ncbi:hypothetical protein ILYODFUR_038273 [Ilyodon furcidens]|uniref:Uncharacterized protein n=1 Tax=Ilyodon furcidens TaxID=33524 RepID=A0ABV0TRI0_9TELE
MSLEVRSYSLLGCAGSRLNVVYFESSRKDCTGLSRNHGCGPNTGETKACRRTFSPQGHSRKSLKAGNLSDTRRSEDSYTDRRPRRHPAQVKTHRGFISKEMRFLLVDSVD